MGLVEAAIKAFEIIVTSQFYITSSSMYARFMPERSPTQMGPSGKKNHTAVLFGILTLTVRNRTASSIQHRRGIEATVFFVLDFGLQVGGRFHEIFRGRFLIRKTAPCSTYPKKVRNTPAAMADPMTPATLGPMAGMSGLTRPSVSVETNC